jgi:large subunit ribosomal protein L32
MANPKYRISKARKGRRRAHHAIEFKSGSTCSNCNEVKHSHGVCEACGFYNGRQVLAPRTASLAMDNEFNTQG